jgi:GTP cyclohydrolase I
LRLDTLPGNYYEILGGDPEKYSAETDRRVVSFCDELRVKREYGNFTTFDSKDDQMIIANHLRVFSFCEHHLLPFYGETAIGYIPDRKILGLSKFQRIVDKFASKPQVQEELTGAIISYINELLNPKGIGIVIKAIHTCVFARGPQSTNAEFTTSAMTGIFRSGSETRQEFLQMIDNNRSRL